MDGEEKIVFLLWNFLQRLDYGQYKAHSIHPINQKQDIVEFIDELMVGPAKLHNY